jgi:glycosyltransferase involved in cell wall biosynthesis
MPRLLLITYHFPPSAASGSFRMLGLARHLPRHDWQVIVVAPPRLPLEPVDSELGGQVPAETVVCPVPYPQGRGIRLLRRLAGNAIWLPPALRACRRAVREHQPDAVLTSSPPHWVHLLGLSVKRHFGIPWVADFRDPWITNNKPPAGRPCRRRWQTFWERRVFASADALIANAPRAGAGLEAAYPEYRDKIHVVTNGYDPESFPPPAPRVPGRPLRIVHAGELYAGRDPRPLLDALKTLHAGDGASTSRWRLCFLGRTGDPGFNLEQAIRDRGLQDHVEIGGQVAYARSLRDMAEADMLLLLDTPGRRLGVPAKLYEYLGAGRPILALAEPDSDVGWVLRESGISHRIVPYNDSAKIEQGLVEMTNGLADNGHSDVDVQPLRAFTREAMAGQVADLLDALVSGPVPVGPNAG